jgi:environmental stress-induced protein Ves
VTVLASDEDMHAFPGDEATGCELLGGPTRDLNVMVRRDAARLRIRSLRSTDALRSDAALIGCLVCDDVQVAIDQGTLVTLPRHAFAWIENLEREAFEWQLARPAARGWWIEANRIVADDHPTD